MQSKFSLTLEQKRAQLRDVEQFYSSLRDRYEGLKSLARENANELNAIDSPVQVADLTLKSVEQKILQLRSALDSLLPAFADFPGKLSKG